MNRRGKALSPLQRALNSNAWWTFIGVSSLVALVVIGLIAVSVVKYFVELDDHFDYVVAGGGTEGAIVAEYLSRSGRYRVLLLEAGDDVVYDPDLQYISEDSLHLQRDHLAEYFWQQQQEPDELVPLNQNHSYTTGRVLGGDSKVGDVRYNRGTARFYQLLAALTEDDIWNVTSMIDIFAEIEQYLGVSNLSYPYRGHDGNVVVTEQEEVSSMATKVAEAFQRVTNLTLLCDYNDLQNATEVGPFHRWQTTTSAGECPIERDLNEPGCRVSTDRVVLNTTVRARDNLVIRTQSTVTRVLFDPRKRAYAVSYLERGNYREAHGKERIILTAGVNTPLILQQSGIGDSEYLTDIGIEVVHPNSNVGSAIYNHNGVLLTFTKNISDTSTGLFEGGAWLPSPIEGDDDPSRTVRRVQVATMNRGEIMEMQLFNLQPYQHGYATIRDNDPLRAPMSSDQIFVGEDGFLDSTFYMEAIRDYGCELSKAFQGEDYAEPIDTAYVMIDPPYSFCDNNAELREWVRTHSTVQAHDWSSSARMGIEEDEMSVCNSRGSVFGVTGLSIADSSVLPLLNPGTGGAIKYGVALNIAKQIAQKRY